MRYRSFGTMVTLALLATGCAVGPQYHRPETALPEQFPEAGDAAPSGKAMREWWNLFRDPFLDQLVARAFERNYDLRQAVARIDETLAIAREAGAGQYPEVDLGASSTRRRISGLTADPPSGPLVGRDHRVQLGSAFELDFWGKLRRASEAARAQALGSQYGKSVVELTLAGAITQNYLALRSLDAQIAVSLETLGARGESLDIVAARHRGGLAGGLELEQARGAKAAAEAQVADLRQQRALVEHRLAVLTATPELLISEGDLRLVPLPPLPPAGLPSELLEARPDIRAAEQQLIAANARIGVAKAALFPTISLTGSVGTESNELANLFKAGAETWTFGLGIDFPIFAAGKYSARVDQANALQQQALVAYQGSIANGFREVRDALTTAARRAEAEAALDTQRQAAAEALRLANVRYQSGYSPYLEVLDAQRNANEATLAYIRNREARLATAVDLFKALGGGWGRADQ